MYFLPAIIAALVGALVLYEIRRSPLGFFWWVAIFALVCVPSFLVPMLGMTMASPTDIHYANLFALCFIATCAAVRVAHLSRFDARRIDVFGQGISPAVYLGAVGTIVLTAGGLAAAFGPDLLATRWDDKHRMGFAFTALSYLGGFYCCVYMKAAGERRWLLASVIFLGFLAIGFLTRSRSDFLLMLSVPMVMLIVQRRHGVLALLLVAMPIVFMVIQQIRYLGSLYRIAEADLGILFSAWIVAIQAGGTDFTLLRHFYDFFAGAVTYPSFFEANTYLRSALLPFPSALIGDVKPENFAFDMAYAVSGVTGWSLHPTVLGDLYANLGIFGCLIGGLLFGGLLCALDRFLVAHGRLALILVPFLISGVFFVARGSVYNGLATIVMSVLVGAAVEGCHRRTRRHLSASSATLGSSVRRQ